MGGSFYAFYFIHPNATDALSLTSYLPDALLISAHSGYSFFECPDCGSALWTRIIMAPSLQKQEGILNYFGIKVNDEQLCRT